MDEQLRPDLSGFVLDLDRETQTHAIMYAATPAWEGAFEDDKVIFRLKKLCKKLNEPIIANNHSIFVPNSDRWKRKIEMVFGTNVTVTWVPV